MRGTKTHKSRREVPLTALDAAPPRIDSRCVFTTSRKCPGQRAGAFDVASTSVAMIEAQYGALLDTAHESMLERLEGRGM